MSRDELESDQRKTLTRIKVLEKKLAFRKPKNEKAARDLADKKKTALLKIEEEHKRANARLLKELDDVERELSLSRKRYLELSGDILRSIECPSSAKPTN